MSDVRVVHGDCLAVLRSLPDASVDAVVTDPPYGLADHRPAELVTALTAWVNGDRERVPDGRGFMGKAWDAFVPPPAVWDECMRVLKPGGHLVAFAGSRTYDLVGLSIRLAGFEIRDGLQWLYGSGFPKGQDVGKAIDKARDDRADIVRVTSWLAEQRDQAGLTNRDLDAEFGTNGMAGHWTSVRSQPAVPTWEQWQQLRELVGFDDDMDAEVWRLNGRKGTPGEAWGQRKVLDVIPDRWAGKGDVLERANQVAGADVKITAPATPDAARWQGWNTSLKPAHEPIVLARKPLSGTVARNVLEHGTGALNVDGCRVGMSDADREASPAGRWPANVLLSHSPQCNVVDVDGQFDSCAPGCPVAELDGQSGTTTSSASPRHNTAAAHNGTASMGKSAADWTTGGHADSGGASRFFPSFRYQAKAPTAERPRVDGVAHPTVKPLALMTWLVRLLCPPGGTVLDPFAGSGTTLQAARDEGMASIGIERDPTYLPLIAARLGCDAATFETFTEPEPGEAPETESNHDSEDTTMALENADTGAPRNPGGAKRDDFADFPRDQYGRPKIIRAELDPATGRWEVPRDAEGKLIKELIAVTRASTLGGAIEYQGGLHRWKSAVVAWGIARSRTLAKRARAVASYSRREDKAELYEIVDKAQAFAESDQAANHGTALHSVFRRIAEGETVNRLVAAGAIDEDDIPACQAFAEAIEPWVVVFAERRVVCDEAQAAGKYDIVVTPRRPMPVTDAKGAVVDVIMPGDLIAVDNKTSSTADYFGEKFAVQLWVYANGRDYDPETGERTEVGVRKDWALILHIPSGSEEGTVAQWHWVNLELGGKLVTIARDVLEGRKLGKRAIVAANLDAEIPDEFLVSAHGNERAVRLAQPGVLDQPDATWAPAETSTERYMRETRLPTEPLPGTVIGPKPECRCVTPTCPECLHIPGCVDAQDPVSWCDCEPGDPNHDGPCRQLAHFPARCPGSGKTWAQDSALGRPLAQRLQASAALEATRSDRDRVRAYLVRQLPKAATLERLTDLWRRARKAGHWDKPDVELDPLFAARGAELKAAQAPAAQLEPAG